MTKEEAETLPNSFEEIFREFDTWYYNRFKNHPEKMAAEIFYEFLQANGMVT
jgi:hypothetical protein